MQMYEVKEVLSVKSTIAANQRLAEGWTLLSVVGTADGVRYVFGRAEAQPAAQAESFAIGGHVLNGGPL